jgi:hypothetical protein
MDMDRDLQTLEDALSYWNQVHSPRTFVVDVLPIIRDASSIDRILARLPANDRLRVIKELRSEYGPDVDLSGEWGMAAAAYIDIEQAKLRHEAFVAHANTVAVPAIRAWLAAHPDE